MYIVSYSHTQNIIIRPLVLSVYVSLYALSRYNNIVFCHLQETFLEKFIFAPLDDKHMYNVILYNVHWYNNNINMSYYLMCVI